MRVIQPEIREDGRVYTREIQPEYNHRFAVKSGGYVCGLIREGEFTAPICVRDSLITVEQMSEVMLAVAMGIAALEEARSKS